MLHLVQSVEGRITPEGIEACADILDISAADVSGVATFYTMYKRKPVGDYHVGVCTNTLCAVMGGDAIFERLKDHLDVGNDETTTDGKITLEHVECNAACDYAPVMMVNWEFMDNMTPSPPPSSSTTCARARRSSSTRGPRHLHLARGRAGARRLPRRPRRRGPGRRAGQPGRARHRARARLDGAGGATSDATRSPPSSPTTGTPRRELDAGGVRVPRRLRRAEEGARHGARTRSSSRSRTPACAAAAAPASRPA